MPNRPYIPGPDEGPSPDPHPGGAPPPESPPSPDPAPVPPAPARRLGDRAYQRPQPAAPGSDLLSNRRFLVAWGSVVGVLFLVVIGFTLHIVMDSRPADPEGEDATRFAVGPIDMEPEREPERRRRPSDDTALEVTAWIQEITAIAERDPQVARMLRANPHLEQVMRQAESMNALIAANPDLKGFVAGSQGERDAVAALAALNKVLRASVEERRESGPPVSSGSIEIHRLEPVSLDVLRAGRTDDWEGLPIPEERAFRMWTPSEGSPKLARVRSVRDGTHVELEFPGGGGSDRRQPINRFSESDREFLEGWSWDSQAQRDFFRSRLARLDLDGFCRVAGWERVAFRVVDNRVSVTATYRGQEVRLNVDTGAERSVVTPEAADRLGLPRNGRVTLSGWHGRIVADDSEFAELEIGESAFSRVPVAILPPGTNPDLFGESDGLLGADILDSGNAAFDFGTETIFFRRNSPGHPRGFAGDGSAVEPEIRDWRKRSDVDSPIRAKFVSANDSTVTIRRADTGTEGAVDIAELSEADAAYVDSMVFLRSLEDDYSKFVRGASLTQYFRLAGDRFQGVYFRRQDAFIVAPVVIDGVVLQFIIDAGVQQSKIRQAVAERRLGRDLYTLTLVGHFGGVDGNTVPAWRDEFDSIEFAGETRHSYMMMISDFDFLNRSRAVGTPIDGAIGVDVLANFGAIVDYDGMSILVRAGGR